MSNSGENVLKKFGFDIKDTLINNKSNVDDRNSNNSSEATVYFYRGISVPNDKTYLIEPSVFRGEDEWKLYHYILQYHSNDFTGMAPIDNLAKMQHLEIPTRLLDVTKNPLVAAFFSVSNLYKPVDRNKANYTKNKSSIIEFKIDEDKIKTFDLDTIKILSHFPLLKEETKRCLIEQSFNEIIVSGIVNIIYRDCECQDIVDDRDKFLEDVSKNVLKLIDGKLLAYMNNKKTKVYDKENKHGYIKISAKSVKYTNAKDSEELIDADKLEFEIFLNTFPQPTHYNFCLSRTDSSTGCPINVSDFLESIGYDGTCLFKKPLSTLLNKFYNEEGFINITKELNELDWQIKCSCPQWYGQYERPLDLLNGLFVNPCVNTDRMRVQQGSFMIFGLSRYWNIERCIKFLEERNCNFDEIYNFIIQNKPLIKNNEKCELFEKHKINIEEFENYVFNVRRYYVKNINKKRKEIIENLKISGIDKQSLGCGLQTTYYQYMEDKSRVSIRKNNN